MREVVLQPRSMGYRQDLDGEYQLHGMGPRFSIVLHPKTDGPHVATVKVLGDVPQALRGVMS